MRTVHDNTEQSRWEITVDEELAGFADYQKTDDGLVVFTHTEIAPKFEGQGVGSELIRHALDDVRRAGLKALPVCPFVEAWIAKHPDYRELDYRARSDS